MKSVKEHKADNNLNRQFTAFAKLKLKNFFMIMRYLLGQVIIHIKVWLDIYWRLKGDQIKFAMIHYRITYLRYGRTPKIVFNSLKTTFMIDGFCSFTDCLKLVSMKPHLQSSTNKQNWALQNLVRIQKYVRNLNRILRSKI